MHKISKRTGDLLIRHRINLLQLNSSSRNISISLTSKKREDKDDLFEFVGKDVLFGNKTNQIYDDKLAGKELPIQIQVRATNKAFFGALQETVTDRKSRHRREKRGSKSPTVEELLRENKEQSFNFHQEAYGDFAAMYGSKNTGTAAYENNFDYVLCNQLNKQKQDKSVVKKRRSAQSQSQKKTSSEQPLKYLSLKDISKLVVPSRNSTLFIRPDDRYPGLPSDVDARFLKEFPLYMADVDKEVSPNDQKDEGIISIDFMTNPDKKLPSVSTILRETMPEKSKKALEQWAKNMIGIMGEVEFKKYQSGMLEEGKLLHKCIAQNLMQNKLLTTEDQIKVGGYWESVVKVLDKVRTEGEVLAIESKVVHPHLHYSGIVDCIAHYKGIPVVIEWKTSSRLKQKASATYDNPLQLAAYLGAMQFDPNYKHLSDVQVGLLVTCYSFGEDCTVMLFTKSQMSKYWETWKKRLSLYWKMHSSIF